MKLYCYPRCSTCKKAEKFLDEKGITYEYIDIKTNPPGKDLLLELFNNNELDIKKYLNTSGLKYKELGLKDKLKDMSIEEIFSLLEKDGMLIKRPLLINDKKVILGFKEDKWNEFIK